MSLDLKINNETLASYVRSDDALEALKVTVGNGQSRLALDVLLEIVNQLCDKIDELDSKINSLNMDQGNKVTVKSKENITKNTSSEVIKEEEKESKEKS